MKINSQQLDRHITGNYGEDQYLDNSDIENEQDYVQVFHIRLAITTHIPWEIDDMEWIIANALEDKPAELVSLSVELFDQDPPNEKEANPNEILAFERTQPDPPIDALQADAAWKDRKLKGTK